ncbi:dTMP kinase [Micrococcoides hystricis]|uniref:Thymidylate kinase n=1 Tax=Micrococcoides hystricis TaxID=1572761 RepID=A0ABV6PAW7_9MICC
MEPTASASLPHRGLFIVFEGGDGVGKSTQLKLLHENLAEAGHSLVLTREPGGTGLGEAVRGLLLQAHSPAGDMLHISDRAEALLFAAARAQHVEELIEPALQAGKIILSDRYVDSSLSYQGGARGLGIDRVRQVNEWATDGLVPDLTILLDLPVEAARARMRDRAAHADRIEAEADAFHEQIRQSFLALAADAAERYLVIDADQDPAAIARVVSRRVEELLNRRQVSAHVR